MSIDGPLLRPLGILSVFVALPILEASLMAASAFLEEGDTLRTTLGALGSVGACSLLIAGAALIMKRRIGRQLALWGSAASILAHAIGALIGLVGGHGVLYGVGFPVAIVLLLRATPSSGLPLDTQKTDARSAVSHDRSDRQPDPKDGKEYFSWPRPIRQFLNPSDTAWLANLRKVAPANGYD